MILLIHILKKKRKLHCQKTPKHWELRNKLRSMEGFGGFLSSVYDGIADICIVPCRREERNGLSVVSSPKYQRMKKKQNESCTADEARASQKQDLSPCITDLKTEEKFMVEMPSSGLKVLCVLFLQVDKKLISLHARYFCNMQRWRGDNKSSLLFMFLLL